MNDVLIHMEIVGELQTNCYFLIDRDKKSAIIIDPGDDGDYINRKIMTLGVKPVLVLITHGHFDHILGVPDIKLGWNIPVYVSGEDNFLVKEAPASIRYFLQDRKVFAPDISLFTHVAQEKLMKQFGLAVIKTPGHTPGSQCYYCERGKFVFAGDTVFADGGVGRTDFSYSSETDLKDSLTRIFKLPNDTVIYPGHGLITTVGQEKMYH